MLLAKPGLSFRSRLASVCFSFLKLWFPSLYFWENCDYSQNCSSFIQILPNLILIHSNSFLLIAISNFTSFFIAIYDPFLSISFLSSFQVDYYLYDFDDIQLRQNILWMVLVFQAKLYTFIFKAENTQFTRKQSLMNHFYREYQNLINLDPHSF